MKLWCSNFPNSKYFLEYNGENWSDGQQQRLTHGRKLFASFWTFSHATSTMWRHSAIDKGVGIESQEGSKKGVNFRGLHTFQPSNKRTRQTPNTWLSTQYCKWINKPHHVLCPMFLPYDLLTLGLPASVGSLCLSDELPDEQLWDVWGPMVRHPACLAHSVVKIDSEVEISPWSSSTTPETSVNTARSLIAWTNMEADGKLLRLRQRQHCFCTF